MEPHQAPLMDKVSQWRVAAQSLDARGGQCLDLTVSPTEGDSLVLPKKLVQDSGGSDIITLSKPHKILQPSDILRELVKVPKVAVTSIASFCFGLVTCWVACRSVQPAGSPSAILRMPDEAGTLFLSPQARRYIGSALKLVNIIVLLLWFRRFMRSRVVSVVPISRLENQSCSPLGVQLVSSRVLSISHSHAGTHADQPSHFIPTLLTSSADKESKDSAAPSFSIDHYNGQTVIVDLSSHIANHWRSSTEQDRSNGVALGIGPEMISTALGGSDTDCCGLELEDVWRILFITRNKKRRQPTSATSCANPLVPMPVVTSATKRTPPYVEDDDYFGMCNAGKTSAKYYPAYTTGGHSTSYLTPAAAELLTKIAPRLLLVGIDGPEVDHPFVQSFSEGAHGIFFRNNIATLENLNLTSAHRLMGNQPCLVGSLLTVFHDLQGFPDARGCSALFFPAAQ